jgi:hypothetical protein
VLRHLLQRALHLVLTTLNVVVIFYSADSVLPTLDVKVLVRRVQ